MIKTFLLIFVVGFYSSSFAFYSNTSLLNNLFEPRPPSINSRFNKINTNLSVVNNYFLKSHNYVTGSILYSFKKSSINGQFSRIGNSKFSNNLLHFQYAKRLSKKMILSIGATKSITQQLKYPPISSGTTPYLGMRITFNSVLDFTGTLYSSILNDSFIPNTSNISFHYKIGEKVHLLLQVRARVKEPIYLANTTQYEYNNKISINLTIANQQNLLGLGIEYSLGKMKNGIGSGYHPNIGVSNYLNLSSEWL